MDLIGNWSYPTSIRFGLGRVKELPEVCLELEMSNPLLVTDKHLTDLPITLSTQKIMENGGLGVAKFSEVDENPNEKNLDAGVERYKAGSHDGVIAFGGGSGLDLGKMIAFYGRAITAYLGFRRY